MTTLQITDAHFNELTDKHVRLYELLTVHPFSTLHDVSMGDGESQPGHYHALQGLPHVVLLADALVVPTKCGQAHEPLNRQSIDHAIYTELSSAIDRATAYAERPVQQQFH